MNYIGQIVFHKTYGEGIIVSQHEKKGNSYISVQFSSANRIVPFLAPECFKQYLTLYDRDVASKVRKENIKKDFADEVESGKHINAQVKHVEQNKAGHFYKPSTCQRFSSLEDFYNAQEHALGTEIAFLQKNGSRHKKLFDGALVEIIKAKYIYSFESDSELNLIDNTPVSLWPYSRKEPVSGFIVNCEEFTVIIATEENLGKKIPVLEFSEESWILLETLVDRLEELKNNQTEIVKELVCDGHGKIIDTVNRGQDLACRMSVIKPITFVWGPPGTGKTETLAKIAILHMEKGERVLMLSYSNVSVDGAIWRVFKKETTKRSGELVRYGYPRDKELLKHEYLTSYKLALRRHPDLEKERSRLTKERQHIARTLPMYVKIGQRLTEIRKKLDAEEKNAVSSASFVATTVSKAIVDSTIYEGEYDTVIFDEASMAYIPQIVFAAGLAKKHFVCMGDFKQLPPIVQSDNSSLSNDKFEYCGIVDAVESNKGHDWMCLLDTQYRMYPEIACFASRTMYHDLLRSGEKMEKVRSAIVHSAPFVDRAMQICDLSGMMSVCRKTADRSRINVLSAIISIDLAISSAKTNEVGIITPYNAQSRLLHAISRDISEQAPQLKQIVCATVHQFQGSEKDVVIYDAVDCYRMNRPGMLLTSTDNNYANRLYNVAVTRARGKMISLVNVDYMKSKSLSRDLIFREMIDSLHREEKDAKEEEVIYSTANSVVKTFRQDAGQREFLKDVIDTQKEIYIDIPDGLSTDSNWIMDFIVELINIRRKGITIAVRTENKEGLPEKLRHFAIEQAFITDPVVVIDKKLVWYGMPPSNAHFISEGKTIPTRFRPIFRIEGCHTAGALYGLLEMGKNFDASKKRTHINDDGIYDHFSEYVSGEIKCSRCGKPMKMHRSKKGGFFLGCSNFPDCKNTQAINCEMVNNYLYFNNPYGKLCPQDNKQLEAKEGPYGVYVACRNDVNKHTYGLDKI